MNGLGQVFASDADFTIYTMGGEQTGVYFACVPNNIKSSVDIYVDLNAKGDVDLYKDVRDPLKQQELMTKLNEVNKMINGLNKTGIYVLPSIDTTLIQKNLDGNPKINDYNTVFKLITNCTKEVSQKLNDVSNGKQTINQMIKIVEKNESDKEFVKWLKEQFPLYVDGITLEDLRQQYYIELGMMAAANQDVQVQQAPLEQAAEVAKSATIGAVAGLATATVVDRAVENVREGNTVANTAGISNITPIGEIRDNNNVATPAMNATNVVPFEQVKASGGIPPVDHSYDAMAQQQLQQKGPVLVRKKSAAFVKYPVFLLAVLAIGSFGIFIGKMFYTYLSQR